MHYVVLVEGKEKQNRLSDLVIELNKKDEISLKERTFDYGFWHVDTSNRGKK